MSTRLVALCVTLVSTALACAVAASPESAAALQGRPYYVWQPGMNPVQVFAIEGTQTAVEFYDYYSSSGHTGFEEANTTIAFLYLDVDDGALSLISEHNKDEVGGSGSMQFEMKGLPEGYQLALLDDPTHELDDFQDLGGGNAHAHWGWGNRTDGMVLDGFESVDNWSVTISPHDFSGIVALQFVSEGAAGPERIELDLSKDFTISTNPIPELAGPYYVWQPGMEPVQVFAIEGTESAVEFYDYYSSSGHTGLEEANSTIVFLYLDVVDGMVSLISEHHEEGADGAGLMAFEMAGLPASYYLAFLDDPQSPDDDQFQDLGDGNAHAHWLWSLNTDGMVLGGFETLNEWRVTITPHDFTGVEHLKFITLGSGGPEYIELDLHKDLTIAKIPEPPSGATIEVAPEVVLGDGQTQAEIRLTLTDYDGRPIPGKWIEFYCEDHTVEFIQPQEATDENGVAIGYVKSSEIGHATIKARIIGERKR